MRERTSMPSPIAVFATIALLNLAAGALGVRGALAQVSDRDPETRRARQEERRESREEAREAWLEARREAREAGRETSDAGRAVRDTLRPSGRSVRDSLRPAGGSFVATPLDAGGCCYAGFPTVLYEGPAPDASSVAAALAQDPEVVIVSTGMSNAKEKYDVLKKRFRELPDRNPAVTWVLGAKGGQDARAWVDPNHRNYDRIRDVWLADEGLTEADVDVVWMLHANGGAGGAPPLPDPAADAFRLRDQLLDIFAAQSARWPNLKLMLVNARNYAGWSPTGKNPEPQAYESGFAVRWAIEAWNAAHPEGPVAVWGPYVWNGPDVWTSPMFRNTRHRIKMTDIGKEQFADFSFGWWRDDPAVRPWMFGP